MQRPATILLVEDDGGEARLIREMLRDSSLGPTVEVEHVPRLEDAVERLRHHRFHACLLDLRLPDSDGLDTLVTVRTVAPRLPVVVFTALDDTLALRALNAGAQDYLRKSQVDSDMLTRALRYAVERQVLLDRLDARHREQRRDHEEHLLRSLSLGSDTPVGSRLLRGRRLSQVSPTIFSELVGRHAALVAEALDRRDRPAEVDLRDDGASERSLGLSLVAEHLGALHADAGDTVELHRAALAREIGEARDSLSALEEQRASELLVELLGLLANYYRSFVWESTGAESER